MNKLIIKYNIYKLCGLLIFFCLLYWRATFDKKNLSFKLLKELVLVLYKNVFKKVQKIHVCNSTDMSLGGSLWLDRRVVGQFYFCLIARGTKQHFLPIKSTQNSKFKTYQAHISCCLANRFSRVIFFQVQLKFFSVELKYVPEALGI